jgi:hypothetical protein
MLSRVVNAVLMLLVGGVFGTVGTVDHASVVELAGVRITWGIVVAVAAVGCLLIGVRLVAVDRVPVVSAAVGVIVPIAVLSQPSFGGSVLIENDVLGWVWMAGAALTALVIVAWPKLPARRARVN